MQRYEMGRLLGQGTFAKVHHARNLKTGISVAIKIIDKERVLKVGMIDQIKREISVMRLIRHPNVVELYEVMASKTKIYFVMEYVKGGELFDKVSKGKLKEDVARKYFQQLISAVDYCHSRGRQDGLLHTTCGTPAYVAPEVINRKGYDGTKADIWSCGVVLYVLLAGYLPFHDSNLMEMYRKIGKGDFKFPNWFSPEVRKLLSKILDPNPKTRISMAKIMQNSWFRKGLVQKPVIAEVPVKEPAHLDVDAIFGPSEGSNSAVESKQELAKPSNLNAFDIISYSAGFDLSGLFEQTEQKKEVRFTSNKTAPTIISKLEDIAKRLRLKIKKRDGGLLKMEGSTEGRKGVLGIETEIFEITPFFHLVEVKKCSGDTLEYQKVMKKDIRPALKDIVWTWQGEQLQQEQPQLGQQQQEEPPQLGQPQQEEQQEQQEPPQLGQQEQQPSLALPVQVVSPQDS
ncbi:hypothetical protein GBA52_019016 [Prunus armeniaca]|nr:hypothetical protein GBA52_019016 [Prunus armeniaca]